MRPSYRTGIILMLLVTCAMQRSWANPGKKVANGMWGGIHLRMEVLDSGAELEFDCGSATVTEPIEVGSDGRFHVSGTFKQGEFGPTREDGPGAREATFTGSLEGNTLNIEMVLSGEDRVQKFTVTHGRPAKLVKCK